jgi:glutaminyl-peptide cyclotransferase
MIFLSDSSAIRVAHPLQFHRKGWGALVLLLVGLIPLANAQRPTHPGFGVATYDLTKQLLTVAPKRFNGSPGHLAAEAFLKDHFKPEAAGGNLLTDEFTVTTPAGLQTMRNYIVKYPGKKDGVIVLASHYETNWPLRNIAFVGANDGACTSAILIEIGLYLRAHPPQGYSVWLVFDDGEEAVKEWSASDSLYGTRHLAAKWSQDGTLGKIKALIVVDMVGDKDLGIFHSLNSTPALNAILAQAAKNTGHTASLSKSEGEEEDDHLPFLKRGVPVLDFIDIDYGPHTDAMPDGYHHTADDTIDKISAQSLQISGDLLFETMRLIDQR